MTAMIVSGVVIATEIAIVGAIEIAVDANAK
jgi:hypothetical protein